MSVNEDLYVHEDDFIINFSLYPIFRTSRIGTFENDVKMANACGLMVPISILSFACSSARTCICFINQQ